MCSYTLVWHDWTAWEKFIDWMALVGHNSIVAPTGQEEVQYKVLTEQFGVSDMEVRTQHPPEKLAQRHTECLRR